MVENEHGVPYIQWLEENHHPVKALFTNANISYERRAILKALQDSSSPLYAPQVASSAGLDYKNVRRMLPRLLHAGEIASPARGQYTALEHASLTTNPTKNSAVSTETSVPTMTTVPSVPN